MRILTRNLSMRILTRDWRSRVDLLMFKLVINELADILAVI
jgi:hypothetical protein